AFAAATASFGKVKILRHAFAGDYDFKTKHLGGQQTASIIGFELAAAPSDAQAGTVLIVVKDLTIARAAIAVTPCAAFRASIDAASSVRIECNPSSVSARAWGGNRMSQGISPVPFVKPEDLVQQSNLAFYLLLRWFGCWIDLAFVLLLVLAAPI